VKPAGARRGRQAANARRPDPAGRNAVPGRALLEPLLTRLEGGDRTGGAGFHVDDCPPRGRARQAA
jgi:hypothetical protein